MLRFFRAVGMLSRRQVLGLISAVTLMLDIFGLGLIISFLRG